MILFTIQFLQMLQSVCIKLQPLNSFYPTPLEFRMIVTVARNELLLKNQLILPILAINHCDSLVPDDLCYIIFIWVNF